MAEEKTAVGGIGWLDLTVEDAGSGELQTFGVLRHLR